MNSAEGPLEKVWLAWSSGKDSAWALHTLRRGQDHTDREGRGDRDAHAGHTAPGVEVVGLLTTVTGAYERVSLHGVREGLLVKQAEAAGLSLRRVIIPPDCTSALYEEFMERAMADARAEGVKAVVFGDLSLADVRVYRERQLARAGMRAIFPLWGENTATLASEMIRGGLGARLTCLDPRVMPRELAGHLFDEEFLERLPPDVDPCGENGEFHTFVFAGPMFSAPIPVEVGETVERDGFVFTDVAPANPSLHEHVQ
jgi:uncharacterized protein (TIGR00290 family)